MKPINLLVTLALSLTIGATLAIAQPVVNFKQGSTTITALLSGKDGVLVNIESAPGTKGAISSVDNPPRIIIDLPGSKIKANKTIEATENPLVKSVRLGAHPNKIRIVIDLKGAALPKFTTSEKANFISIGILSPNSPSSPVTASTPAPVPTVEAAPAAVEPPPAAPAVPEETQALATPLAPSTTVTVTTTTVPLTVPPTTLALPPTTLPAAPATTLPAAPKVEASASVQKKTLGEVLHEPFAAESATPVATPPPTVQEGEVGLKNSSFVVAAPTEEAEVEKPAALEPGVQKISFQYTDDQKTPGIKIDLNGRPEFKLLRKGDREYQLTIQGSKLAGDYLSLAQYPPQDFDGFTHLMATTRGQNSEIIIGVERSTKLTAFTKEGHIWIKVAMPS